MPPTYIVTYFLSGLVVHMSEVSLDADDIVNIPDSDRNRAHDLTATIDKIW
jgi:hypothetical protein